MARATLSYVALTSIEPNPFRDLKNYPYDQNKLAALVRSIAEVDLWPGMIARQRGRNYELAFGHHRLEAARKSKLSMVPLIIRDLSDEEMVGFMGRENMEDFNSDFLVQLNAWEAAIKVNTRSTERIGEKPIEVARLLGWTKGRSGTDNTETNDTAKACHVARKLIEVGHLSRDDLSDMSVKAAREVVERIHSRMEMLDKLGKMGGRPAAEIEREKKSIGRAGKKVIKKYRAGEVSHKDLRKEIDYEAVKDGLGKEKVSPLFAAFAKEVAESIHKMLVSDTVAVRLAEIHKALPLMTMEEDRLALRRVDFALAEHEETTAKWRDRLAPRGQKVVPFKLLKKE